MQRYNGKNRSRSRTPPHWRSAAGERKRFVENDSRKQSSTDETTTNNVDEPTDSNLKGSSEQSENRDSGKRLKSSVKPVNATDFDQNPDDACSTTNDENRNKESKKKSSSRRKERQRDENMNNEGRELTTSNRQGLFHWNKNVSSVFRGNREFVFENRTQI